MADYRLTSSTGVIRTADSAYVPDAAANLDWLIYQEWLAVGGVPDPYVPSPSPPPAPEDVVLFDHENRLRAIEGQPPLTLGDFLANKMKAGR